MGGWSGSFRGAGVPSVAGLCFVGEPAERDDDVGGVEVRVMHVISVSRHIPGFAVY